jgi:hypothetical protein
MNLSPTCKRCNEPITGENEDDLVANVQTHVRGHGRRHGISHTVSRRQVLARLRRQEAKESNPKP